jgi:hypothetical protein
MYEYELINIKTNEETILFGRDIAKAMEKANLNKEEWRVLRMEYVD